MFNVAVRRFLCVPIVIIVAFCSHVLASDVELLDVLVERGVLTSAEASNIKKQSVEVVELRSDTQAMSFFGRLQIQYLSLSVDDANTSETKKRPAEAGLF